MHPTPICFARVIKPLALLLVLGGIAATLLPAAPVEPAPVVAPSDEDRALVFRADAGIMAAQNTAGREAANFLHNDWPKMGLAQLRGASPATADDLKGARSVVRGLVETIEKGPTWPVPAATKIPRSKSAPLIDGRLTDKAWKNAWRMEGMYSFGNLEKVDAPRTTWLVTWDQKFLYFGFDCEDPYVVAPPIERDGHVYNHDCVEMFILPEFRSGLYWELIVSPTGSIFDSLQSKRFDGWGPNARPSETITGLKVAQHIRGTANNNADVDQGYSVEVAVPFDQLPTYTRGNSPKVGDKLHLMLARLDQNKEPMKPYAPVPLLSWGHNIWNHMPVELAK